METVLILMVVQGALGAFDTLYHHEWTERLTRRPQAARELRLHGVRTLLYAVVFAGFGGIEFHGAWGWVFAAILLVELAITLEDFLVEDRTRDLPPSERVTHTILAVIYGAILALFVPELAAWIGRDTAFVIVDRGPLGWVMYAFAAGVALWGVRDLARARVMSRPSPSPASLVAALGATPRALLVTGGTGFIGTRLCAALLAAGHRVTVLTRDIRKGRDLVGATLVTSLDAIDERAAFDAIVNLAGEKLDDGRWTKRKKERLLASRLGVTQSVLRLVERLRTKPVVLISGSAIGYYGTSETAEYDELSVPGYSFAHHLCEEWEFCAREATRFGVRVCLLRTGLVLGTEGGALSRMLLPFEMGVGGRMGSGRQWMSWIHGDDLVRLIAHAIATPTLRGALNATAPVPVRNAEFTQVLAKSLRRPAIMPMPASVLRLLLSEMAEELLLTGQRVVPRAAQASGFRFDHPTIGEALADLLAPPRHAPADASRRLEERPGATPTGPRPA